LLSQYFYSYIQIKIAAFSQQQELKEGLNQAFAVEHDSTGDGFGNQMIVNFEPYG